MFSLRVITLPPNALYDAGTAQQQKSKSINCISKNRKNASAERQSRKQILWGTVISQFAIHYEDFSFLFRGESAPFAVTVPFTPFSVPFLEDLPLVTAGFLFTGGAWKAECSLHLRSWKLMNFHIMKACVMQMDARTAILTANTLKFPVLKSSF